jgi:hypothetical protein
MKQKTRPGAGKNKGGTNGLAILKSPLLLIVLGVLFTLSGAVSLFSGGGGAESGKAFEQGKRAMDQVRGSVQTMVRVLRDEKVASLAALALDTPENSPELRQYLAGRISDFRDFRLFPSDAYLVEAAELGDNGWILLDMFNVANASGIAPLQIIPEGSEQVVAGMVARRARAPVT